MSARVLAIRDLSVYDHLISNGPYVQCVRWKRKPIWLPTAKSKVFRVPTRPSLSPEEMKELKRLNDNYNMYTKSLRSFFINIHTANLVKSNPEALKIQAAKDFSDCSRINNMWNERVAEERNQRLALKKKNREQEIMMKLEAKRERDMEIQERIEKVVRKAKEEAATFITPDKIDEAIENALQTATDHNFAIDIDGNVYNNENKNASETKEHSAAVV